MSSRIFIVPLFVFLLLSAAALSEFSQSVSEENDKKSAAPHVKVQKPQRKTVYRKITIPGETIADQDVVFYARVTGYLDKLNIDVGSWVKKGDLLGEISVPELVKELEKLRAEIIWRESQYKRAEELVKKGPNLVTKDQLDELNGKAQMIKADIERLSELINFSKISALFDGVVTERWVDEGSLVKSGETRLFRIQKINPIRVRVHVPETEVRNIDQNAVKVLVNELNKIVFEGAVSRNSWGLNTNTKTMMLEIDIENGSNVIRPGMFALVTLDIEKHENALVIPAQALIIKRKKSFVFVVKDNIAKELPVEIGFDDGIEVEISNGLTENDEIVTEGKNMISDGEKVRTGH
ncbi:MAG: efflux RND transporter periplasmic adaptor subunit [Planctomycetes bacterium]|nr:efflux RND transporter periplasmic adaptor subunit [Planctomycetota bacterium]